MTIAIAIAAGPLIGLSLGALGGGGSILTVPVLVYGLGQSAHQATTGSLVVVGITSLAGAITAYRAGNALLTRGVMFGVVAYAPELYRAFCGATGYGGTTQRAYTASRQRFFGDFLTLPRPWEPCAGVNRRQPAIGQVYAMLLFPALHASNRPPGSALLFSR